MSKRNKNIVFINVLQLQTDEKLPVKKVLVVHQGVVITKLYNFFMGFCLIDFVIFCQSLQ